MSEEATVVTVRFTTGELNILDAARQVAEDEPNRSQYIRRVVMQECTKHVVAHAGR